MNWVVPMNTALVMVIERAGQAIVTVLLSLELYAACTGTKWLVDITAAMALTILAGLYLIERLNI